ncbi:MAG: DUF5666 domain-containing protein [Terracidiphilus sp.]
MKFPLLSAIVLVLCLAAAHAREISAAAAQAGQPPSAVPASPEGAQDPGGGQWIARPGLRGTVTAVAAGHYTIQTATGAVYTVNLDANTRILRQMVWHGHPGEGSGNGDRAPSGPQTIDPSGIRVGDRVSVLGQVEDASRSVAARLVLKLDPERARRLDALDASYGKTWLMGQVTAISETTVTLQGALDRVSHSFVTGGNTQFRKLRQPATLSDLEVGDRVRVEGAVEDGSFVATRVSILARRRGRLPVLPPSGQPR